MPRFWIVVGGGALLVVVLTLGFLWTRRPDYPQARPGETLIAIGQFANYTGGAQGYNVAGRVREALERELTADRLSAVRAAPWPEVIPDAPAAQAVARRSGAALVIWGEYDSGRAVARLTTSKVDAEPDELRVEKLTSSPGDLPAVINGDLPEEIRYVALLTLGQLYVNQGDLARARAILEQAADRPPTERRPWLDSTSCWVMQTNGTNRLISTRRSTTTAGCWRCARTISPHTTTAAWPTSAAAGRTMCQRHHGSH